MSQTTYETPMKRPVLSLFDRAYLPVTLMLAGGTLVYTLDDLMVGTLMPSVVRDLGGLALLSWATTLYVVGAMTGSILVAVRPQRVSLNAAFVLGTLICALGSIISAAAPNMAAFLAGRLFQGLGAGLFATLGYSFLRFAYPESHWRGVSTLYSLIWGVSTFLGPAVGGLFANQGHWRGAFLALLPLLAVLALLAPRTLPRGMQETSQTRLPWMSICLLPGGVFAVSVSATLADTRIAIGLLLLSVLCFAGMVWLERRSQHRLLPLGATRPLSGLGSAFMIILLVKMVLACGVYIAFFLQHLHGLLPMSAGYLDVLSSLGWTCGAVITSRFRGRNAGRMVIAGATLNVMAVLFLMLFIPQDNRQSAILILAPLALALFCKGLGIGLAYSHLVAKILSLSASNDKDKASAALNTIASTGSALGAAIAGLVVNNSGLIDPGGVAGNISASFWLFGLFCLPGLLAIGFAVHGMTQDTTLKPA
jgi:MFS family permease